MRLLQSSVMLLESQCDVVMFWDWEAPSVWQSSMWYKRIRSAHGDFDAGGGGGELAPSEYRQVTERARHIQQCLRQLQRNPAGPKVEIDRK